MYWKRVILNQISPALWPDLVQGSSRHGHQACSSPRRQRADLGAPYAMSAPERLRCGTISTGPRIIAACRSLVATA
eukprot:954927-Rhodomonas_salina.5